MAKQRRKGHNKGKVRKEIVSSGSYGQKRNNTQPKIIACNVCRQNMRSDSGLSGLYYCVHCSLFYWFPQEAPKGISLLRAFSAIKTLSGVDILFSDRIAGIISSILPQVEDGILIVLRKLSTPELSQLVEIIKSEDSLNEIEVTAIIKKSGLAPDSVIAVFNALREALGKHGIKLDRDNNNYLGNLIISFSCSNTLPLPGERIRISWDARDDSKLSYTLTTGSNSRPINPKGSIWLTPDKTQEVKIEALFGGNQIIESRTIQIVLSELPRIIKLLSSHSNPIIETEKIKLQWEITDAEKITLVHRYSDHEQLTIDVTEFQSEYSFTALRSEMVEIIAERRGYKVSKSLPVEVMPLPRFKVNEIPKFVNMPELNIARISHIFDPSKTEKLYGILREIVSLSELKPYLSISENINKINNRISRIFK